MKKVKLELVQGPRGPQGKPLPMNMIKALGTLFAFKVAEGVLHEGHAVLKRARKRIESKLHANNRREKTNVL